MTKEKKQRRKYVPPKIETSFLEMEYCIAAGSARVSPSTTGGFTDAPPTEWEGSDDNDIITPF